MGTFTMEQREAMGLVGTLPAHVAIIMDGNGRWAQQRNLPRTLGHRAGMERLRGIIRLSSDLQIHALSMYAFSTENWKRPEEEVGALFALLLEYFSREIDELHQNAVKIRILGDTTLLPTAVQETVHKAVQKTAENDGLRLNIALNYGSQNELLRAMRSLASDAATDTIKSEEIDAALLESRLDTAGLPPVDYLIRTGGEKRLSNFLLYQAAYAELSFIEDYWPDFSGERYLEMLRVYLKRARRYGSL